jgi:hypothetical protein
VHDRVQERHHGHVCDHGPVGLPPRQQPPRGAPSVGWIGGSTIF